MTSTGAVTLLRPRRDLACLLELEACIEAVERAFRLHGEGRTIAASTL